MFMYNVVTCKFVGLLVSCTIVQASNVCFSNAPGLGVRVLGDDNNQPRRIAVWSRVTLNVAVTDCNNRLTLESLRSAYMYK